MDGWDACTLFHLTGVVRIDRLVSHLTDGAFMMTDTRACVKVHPFCPSFPCFSNGGQLRFYRSMSTEFNTSIAREKQDQLNFHHEAEDSKVEHIWYASMFNMSRQPFFTFWKAATKVCYLFMFEMQHLYHV